MERNATRNLPKQQWMIAEHCTSNCSTYRSCVPLSQSNRPSVLQHTTKTMGAGASKPNAFPPLQLQNQQPFSHSMDGGVTTNSFNPQHQQQTFQNVSSIANKNLYLAATVPSLVVSAKKLAAVKKKEKEDARKRLLEEYPELADSLELVREWMKEIEKDKDEDAEKKKMGLRTKKWLEELYILYFEHEETEHKKILGDQISQDRGGQIFTEYMKFLTEDGKETPTSGYTSECLESLRAVCWNYSDASLSFSEELGRMGMFPLLVADLVTFLKSVNDSRILSNIILPCISILHNCAKSSDNKRYIKEAKTVETVIPYTKVTHPELKMIAMMTLAYVIDEKDNDVISADGSMIKFILSYLKGALKSYDHKYDGFSAEEIASGLMHLASNDKNKVNIVNEGVLPMLVELMETGIESEKATGAKTVWVLSFSDENKDKIRKEPGMMQNLESLSKTTGEARGSASGALWVLDDEERVKRVTSLPQPSSLTLPSSSLFFSKEKKKMKSKSLSKDRNAPRKSKIIESEKSKSRRHVAAEISCGDDFSASDVESEGEAGLEDESEEEKEEEEEEKEEEEEEKEEEESGKGKQVDVTEVTGIDVPSSGKHVMISYQWGCQKLMIRVKERLERLNYNVWIDIESMGGSTLQAMAEAVENSEAVLVCMSQKYKESPNCRTEAEYAYKLGKTMIPIKVEPMYEPDGWLGAIQGAKFYFDFSNLMLFENIFSKLIKEIGDKGKQAITELDGPVPPPALTRPTFGAPGPERVPAIKPVEKWSKEEMDKWASTFQITSKKITNLDGESLIFLHSLKSTAPEFFYKYVSEKFGITDLRDLMNLTKGLGALDL